MIFKLRQVFNYLFPKLKDSDIELIKGNLDEQEQSHFFSMSNYDKKHSYKVFKSIMKNDILKDDKLYRRLALLHDCGKASDIGFLERVRYSFIKRGRLEFHPKRGYEKMRDLDYKLALLILKHHNKNIDNIKLREFQKIDDRN